MKNYGMFLKMVLVTSYWMKKELMLIEKSDSQLITSQISGEYQTKGTQLCKYLAKVKSLAEKFKFFEAIYVPREQNSRADLLARLASTKRPGNNKTVIHVVVTSPNTDSQEVLTISAEAEGWMTRCQIHHGGLQVVQNGACYPHAPVLRRGRN